MENIEINFYKVKIVKDYFFFDDKINPLHYITIVFKDNTERRVGMKLEDFVKFHSLYYKLK